MDENTVFEGKTAAVLGYITFVGLIIGYFMNSESKNPFAAFHLRQSLGLTLSYFLIMIPLSMLDIPLASLGFLVLFFVLWLFGIVSAFQGKRQLVPLVGGIYQKLFGGDSN
ncbi:DUF4870 domain-containing protein [Dokdonia sp. Hel_I_53]|uniref:DUF4870 domain-containing protein n=1 Tax=Dokdonia sp. Hel_I_53 TaxID=1566287 RepID=UPI001199B04C|nr:hypothetical protein [Dokdonia sp. Hel_I_53]TVZ51472.1 putative membrane protein [Dokdonia sp. Hel_I_53]